MDTSDFDSQSKQNVEVYKSFMGFMRNSAILIAIVLILMAYFLL